MPDKYKLIMNIIWAAICIYFLLICIFQPLSLYGGYPNPATTGINSTVYLWCLVHIGKNILEFKKNA